MRKVASSLGALLLAACATPPPSGPGILVLPGSGKTFDQFRFDDAECRNYAQSIVGKTSEQVGSVQQQYDHAYTQCMYARGHRVPVSGRYSDASPPVHSARTPPPPPPGQPPAEAPPDYRPQ
jgi:hypothetical protein